MIEILVINPNSTRSMTDEIEISLQRSCGDIKECKVSYMTGPEGSPVQIDGLLSSARSCEHCLPLVTDEKSRFWYRRYDGILVCCFSDHPLVAAIQTLEDAPLVVGLLGSSVEFATFALKKPFSIITSNQEWVQILDTQTQKFLPRDTMNDGLWKGTVSTGLEVLALHEGTNYDRIANCIWNQNVANLGSQVVILGCAGFSGMQYRLSAQFGGKVFFVDPVVVGFRNLVSNVRYVKSEMRTE